MAGGSPARGETAGLIPPPDHETTSGHLDVVCPSCDKSVNVCKRLCARVNGERRSETARLGPGA